MKIKIKQIKIKSTEQIILTSYEKLSKCVWQIDDILRKHSTPRLLISCDIRERQHVNENIKYETTPERKIPKNITSLNVLRKP